MLSLEIGKVLILDGGYSVGTPTVTVTGSSIVPSGKNFGTLLEVTPEDLIVPTSGSSNSQEVAWEFIADENEFSFLELGDELIIQYTVSVNATNAIGGDSSSNKTTSQTITITIVATSGIVVMDDSESTAEDTPVTISVLENDMPTQGLTIASLGSPSNGTTALAQLFNCDVNFVSCSKL